MLAHYNLKDSGKTKRTFFLTNIQYLSRIIYIYLDFIYTLLKHTSITGHISMCAQAKAHKSIASRHHLDGQRLARPARTSLA